MQVVFFYCDIGYIVHSENKLIHLYNDDLLSFSPIKQLLQVALDPNLANSVVASSILTLGFKLEIFFCLKKNHKALPQFFFMVYSFY